MILEGITTCVGYADFLAETLPINLPHFDRMTVVTDFKDTETIELCRKYNVYCYPTDVFYSEGNKFAKARGIDFGLAYLERKDWIVHWDADMVLPRLFRNWLEWKSLDASCIYGIDRVLCRNYDEWVSHKKFIYESGSLQWDYFCRVHPPPFPLGARIAIRQYGGYVPIGYTQIFHGSMGRRYPLFQSSAEHTDVSFAIQWPSKNRILLPELIGIHLESEPSKMGANWNGRTTSRFGPALGQKPLGSLGVGMHYSQ